MSSPRPAFQVLTDAQIGEILTSGEAQKTLSERFGCSIGLVSRHKRKLTKRSLHVANALGLLPPPGEVRGWSQTDGSVITGSSDRIRGAQRG